MFELDHVWVAAPDPDAAVSEIRGLGFVVGPRRVHEGTGTAHHVVWFHNAYLELLWVDDERLLRAPGTRRTGLLERLTGRDGASPVGISFRYVGGTPTDAPLPVPTWGWQAPFLPPDAVPIPIARDSDRLAEPCIFASLVTARPDTRDVPLQGPLGLREVTGVDVDVAGVQAPSDTLRTMEVLGIARCRLAARPRLTLTLDRGGSGRSAALGQVPLTLRW